MPSQWTNEATNPSMSRDRGFYVTHKITKQLDVPACAQVALASAAAGKFQPQPLFVGNKTISSIEETFSTTMVMSFNKGGKDVVTTVTTSLDEPIVAELYTYKCEGKTTHLAYMPKCQNLALLTPRTEIATKGWYGGSWGGTSSEPGTPIPEVGPLWLFIAGILALALSIVLKNKRG